MISSTSDSSSVPDLFPAVLARFAELSQTALARRLAAIDLGPTDLWDALRYDLADLLFDEAYRGLHPNRQEASSDARRAPLRGSQALGTAVRRNLWQAQLGEELLVGLLSARLGFVGDVIEKGMLTADRLRDRSTSGRVDVLVAGSLYRTAVVALAPVLQELRARHGLESLALAHDDVLLRHRRAFVRAGMPWRSAAAFLRQGDEIEAHDVVRRAQAALSADQDFPAALAGARLFSERYLRRRVMSFCAAREAMKRLEPALLVIPDERQPLARLVALEARKRGLPVVSAPLDRDQIYRKTPLWGSLASTRMLAFSRLAARFMGRAGVPEALFEVVHRVRPSSEPSDQGDAAATFRARLGLDAHARIVLFASQGQAQNVELIPMVKAGTATLADAELVIRPHPYESRALVRLMSPEVHVSNASTARDALLAADVVLTHSSFMAMEAALLCRPVVLISTDSVPSLLPLLTEGLAVWASGQDELRAALADLLGGGAARLAAAQGRLREEQARLPGREYAANLIAELARGPSPKIDR